MRRRKRPVRAHAPAAASMPARILTPQPAALAPPTRTDASPAGAPSAVRSVREYARRADLFIRASSPSLPPAMYPSQHAALSALALVPLRLRGWSLSELALFAAGGVLIDVDHDLAYVAKTGDWSLPNAYRWHVERVPPTVHERPHVHRVPLVIDPYRPFHAVAPIALLFTLAWVKPPAVRAHSLASLLRLLPLLRPLAWGVLFHRLCDYALETFQRRPGIPVEPPNPPPG